MHVSAIKSLLIVKRAALQRLLDLYLSGEFHKDLLIDKKHQVVKEIGELERERARLLATIRGRTIAADDEETLVGFAQKVAAGLDSADSNFQTRRDVIEALGVEAILSLQEGSKTLRIQCILGKDDKEHYALSPNVLEALSDKPL